MHGKAGHPYTVVGRKPDPWPGQCRHGVPDSWRDQAVLDRALATAGCISLLNIDVIHPYEGACQVDELGRAWVVAQAAAMSRISYRGYRFPPDIIQRAVWLYFRFTLSLTDVEDLLGRTRRQQGRTHTLPDRRLGPTKLACRKN